MNITLNKWVLASMNWLFPRKCIACKVQAAQVNHPCCAYCYEHLPFQPHCCTRCGQIYAADTDICGRCIAAPPPFDACFCPFQYETPISDHIRHFKYYNRPELAKPLAELLANEIIAKQLEMPELLIPTPLHISRLRERGYNQSILLAKSLGSLLNIPVNANIVRKHRKTAPQAQLTLKQRAKNLKNSFKLTQPPHCKSVAIVDDVVTTGHTAAEIAKILRTNGVDCIQAWGIAHTV